MNLALIIVIVVALLFLLRRQGQLLTHDQHGAEAAFIEQIEHSTEIDGVNEQGMTPLQQAIEDEWHDGLERVLERTPDPDVRGPGGITALHLAARKNDQILIDRLLTLGARVDTGDNSGKTPLWMAAGTGAMLAIMILHEHGARLDAAEHNHGLTPLMIAAMHGRIGSVDTLLKLGADAALKDNEGRTAGDLALDHLDFNLGAHVAVNDHLHAMVERLQQAESTDLMEQPPR